VNDIQKQRLTTGLKWAIGIVGAAIAAPVILLAVKGIIGLAIAGVVGLVAINLGPWLANELANWKLKGLKWSSKKNPVETLQRVHLERTEAANEFRMKIGEFSGKVEQFRGKTEQFKTQYPAEAPKFEAQLRSMQQLLVVRENRYRDVVAQLGLFQAEIQKASAIWEMAQASAALTKAAGMTPDDPYEKIKAETAVDSIQESLARSMSDLRLALLDEQLPQGASVPSVMAGVSSAQSLGYAPSLPLQDPAPASNSWIQAEPAKVQRRPF
jgi:hypothetical protein